MIEDDKVRNPVENCNNFHGYKLTLLRAAFQLNFEQLADLIILFIDL